MARIHEERGAGVIQKQVKGQARLGATPPTAAVRELSADAGAGPGASLHLRWTLRLGKKRGVGNLGAGLFSLGSEGEAPELRDTRGTGNCGLSTGAQVGGTVTITAFSEGHADGPSEQHHTASPEADAQMA